MLRTNDFIWSCVVNNYLLGRPPFPFDLLYWNADSTRMPAAMHSFYLRNMYQENLLSKPGGISLDGVPIDLRKISTPSFLLSTREDHIAPWRSTYAATELYRGPVKFVLSASGHIAGGVNPPGVNMATGRTKRTRRPRFLVAEMGELDLAIRRGRGAGAAPGRRQAPTDRGRPRLLRQGARRRLTEFGVPPPAHG